MFKYLLQIVKDFIRWLKEKNTHRYYYGFTNATWTEVCKVRSTIKYPIYIGDIICCTHCPHNKEFGKDKFGSYIKCIRIKQATKS